MNAEVADNEVIVSEAIFEDWARVHGGYALAEDKAEVSNNTIGHNELRNVFILVIYCSLP